MKCEQISNPEQFSERDLRVLSILVDVLEKGDVLRWYYCLGAYAEQGVCLEAASGRYVVYVGERRNKSPLFVRDDICDACDDLIRALPVSTLDKQAMRLQFKTGINYMDGISDELLKE